jgi:hypothetical protein
MKIGIKAVDGGILMKEFASRRCGKEQEVFDRFYCIIGNSDIQGNAGRLR